MDRINTGSDGGQLAQRRGSALGNGRRSGGRRSQKAGRGRPERAPAAGDVPFSVKVSRRVNYARSKLFARLGLYGDEQLAPLGMFIDVYV